MLRSVILLLALALVAMQPVPSSAEELNDAYSKGLELFRAERYDEALPQFEKALSLAEARYGQDDPRTAIELNNLAEVYRVLGRLGEAEPLYKRALALDEKSLGHDNPGLATTLNNLALLYRAQNRLGEAEQLYTRSLDILERALGPNHPNVAKSLNNLAVLYDAEGRRDRARPLIERAFTIARDTLGPSHPTTIMLGHNLETMSSEPMLALDESDLSLDPSLKVPRAPVVEPAAGTHAAAPAQAEAPAHTPAPAQVHEANATSAASASSGAFAVHLSSVRSPEAANEEWKRLAANLHLPASWKQITPQRVDIQGKGTFYRVAGGAFATRSEAAHACAEIKAKGEYCGVIAR